MHVQVRAWDVDPDIVAVRDEELALGAARANLDGRAVVHARIRQAVGLVHVPGVDVLHGRRRRRWCRRDAGRVRARGGSAAGRPDLIRVPGRTLVRLGRTHTIVQVEALVAARESDTVVGREEPVLGGEAGVAGVHLGRPVIVRVCAGVEAAARRTISVHKDEGTDSNAQVGPSKLNRRVVTRGDVRPVKLRTCIRARDDHSRRVIRGAPHAQALYTR
jgi:hypothetical protein